MTDFRTFLIAARPLYIDGAMKVNFTVDELVKFVEDYMKDNQPIVTVEMHEPNCTHDFEYSNDGIYVCTICKFHIDTNVKHTQINHLSTKF